MEKIQVLHKDLIELFQKRDFTDNYEMIAPNGMASGKPLELSGISLNQSILPAFDTSKAIMNLSVEEFWYCVEGKGEFWRYQYGFQNIDEIKPHTCFAIPKESAFQIRNNNNKLLKFIVVRTPSWEKNKDSVTVRGRWDYIDFITLKKDLDIVETRIKNWNERLLHPKSEKENKLASEKRNSFEIPWKRDYGMFKQTLKKKQEYVRYTKKTIDEAYSMYFSKLSSKKEDFDRTNLNVMQDKIIDRFKEDNNFVMAIKALFTIIPRPDIKTIWFSSFMQSELENLIQNEEELYSIPNEKLKFLNETFEALKRGKNEFFYERIQSPRRFPIPEFSLGDIPSLILIKELALKYSIYGTIQIPWGLINPIVEGLKIIGGSMVYHLSPVIIYVTGQWINDWRKKREEKKKEEKTKYKEKEILELTLEDITDIYRISQLTLGLEKPIPEKKLCNRLKRLLLEDGYLKTPSLFDCTSEDSLSLLRKSFDDSSVLKFKDGYYIVEYNNRYDFTYI